MSEAAPAPDNPEPTNLPALGSRGQGWFLLQVLFLLAILASGFIARDQWAGAVRIASVVLGIVMIVLGAALAYRGIRDLGRSLSPLPRPLETAVLIQDGVYRKLRHPIYAALIVIAIGWSLLMASFLALGLALALALLLDLKARREEVWLAERYPEYSEYASHTKRFVPGVY